MDELEAQFEQAMHQVIEQTRREVPYNPTYIVRMIADLGGVDAAHRLLATDAVSTGLTNILLAGRGDLTIEALVLRPEFAPLFTVHEQAVARTRLGITASAESDAIAVLPARDGLPAAEQATARESDQEADKSTTGHSTTLPAVAVPRWEDTLPTDSEPAEDSEAAEAEDSIISSGDREIPLPEWQTQANPDKPLARRLLYDYPQWIAELDPAIDLHPQKRRGSRARINLILKGKWFQHLTFNQHWDLYACMHDPTPGDIAYLQTNLSDPTSLRAVAWGGSGDYGLPLHRFYVRTEADYAVLQTVTQGQIARIKSAPVAQLENVLVRTSTAVWPPAGTAPAFVLYHKKDDTDQQYGETFWVSMHHYGEVRELRTAAEAAGRENTPLYVLVARPSAQLTAWAQVHELQPLPLAAGRQTSEQRWQIRLDQHEFPIPLRLKDHAELMSPIPWLERGADAAFLYMNVRQITATDFNTLVATARRLTLGSTWMMWLDAAYAALEETGSTLDLNHLHRETVQRLGAQADAAPTFTAFRSALLSDARFVQVGGNGWMRAQGTAPPAHVLPMAWPQLQSYLDLVRSMDPGGETEDELVRRAQAAGAQNPNDVALRLIQQLQQFRLIADGGDGHYQPQPYTAGADTALRRLMVLALLLPAPVAQQTDLPARSILAQLQSATAQPDAQFAPMLPHLDVQRLLAWYVEAGLITHQAGMWQATPAALDPLPGNDPAGRVYNEFLALLQAGDPGLLPANGPLQAVADLDARIQRLAEELLFDPILIRRIYRSLRAGRHIILSGPPGTGKTALARRLPALLWEEPAQTLRRLGTTLDSPPVIDETVARAGYRSVVVTATEDWGVRDVVQGIAPQLEGEDGKRTLTYTMRYGHITRALLQHYEDTADGTRLPAHRFIRHDYEAEGQRYRGVWLVIDEFNRAPIDAAFGGLLTTLGGDQAPLAVDTVDGNTVHIPLPADFRIIGTLNSFDRHFLNQISEAMKRRFDFIEVLPPRPAEARYEEGIAVYRALKALEENGFAADIRRDGSPPTYHLGDQLAARSVSVAGVQRYEAQGHGEAQAVLTAFWRIFSAIRVFRLLGTAQAIAVYQILFAGVLTGMSWTEALDTALADSLADQLQVLTRDEQRILAALLRHGEDVASFDKAVTTILTDMPIGRQQALLRSLVGADERAEGAWDINPDQVEILVGALTQVFAPGGERLSPPRSQFQRRLRELMGERGV